MHNVYTYVCKSTVNTKSLFYISEDSQRPQSFDLNIAGLVEKYDENDDGYETIKFRQQGQWFDARRDEEGRPAENS